jgi:hypothetical protein
MKDSHLIQDAARELGTGESSRRARHAFRNPAAQSLDGLPQPAGVVLLPGCDLDQAFSAIGIPAEAIGVFGEPPCRADLRRVMRAENVPDVEPLGSGERPEARAPATEAPNSHQPRSITA